MIGSEFDDVFTDLEQRAAGFARTQRDADLADLASSEYAEVELASRLHASVGRELSMELRGSTPVSGRLLRVGAGWCSVASGPQGQEGTHVGRGPTVIRVAAVVALRGVSPRAVPAGARPLTARLGLGSVLRELGRRRLPVVVALSDGSRRAGTLGRVGADFLELVDTSAAGATPALVPFGSVTWLRPR